MSGLKMAMSPASVDVPIPKGLIPADVPIALPTASMRVQSQYLRADAMVIELSEEQRRRCSLFLKRIGAFRVL